VNFKVYLIAMVVCLSFVIGTADSSEPSIYLVQTEKMIQKDELDVFCLAKNIYHEARGEPLLGQYAVAQVTVNRMKHARYPDTICNVVMQPAQFSWTSKSNNKWNTPSGNSWESAIFVAKSVLLSGVRVRGMDEVLFFHATYVSPNWASSEYKVARIGLHVFYSNDR